MQTIARRRAIFRAEFGCAVAIFQAELRSIRRSASCALVAGVAVGAAGLVYGHHADNHAFAAVSDPFAGNLGPRYLLPSIGTLLLWLLLFATVLLASGAPSRDRRERLADALDTRPASNLSLAAGRALAVAAVAWLQILAAALLVQATGHIAVAFDWHVGAPLEAWSLAGFLLLDAPVALLLFSSLTVLLAVVLRSWLAAAAVALGMLLAFFWTLFQLPVYLLPAASPIASYGATITELAPSFADGTTLVQRGALLALAVAALLFAAACHRRLDATHVRGRVAGGVALAAVGTAMLATLAWQAQEGRQQRSDWLAEHRAAAAAIGSVPRIARVEGEVRIVPDRALHLDIALRLRMPDDGADALVFTLNPGLAVESVTVDGAAASFRHEDGLLTVRPDAAVATSQTTVTFRARGAPDADFAYLDSAVDWRDLTPGRVHSLGTEAAIFEPDYVALMPGAFWLPLPGAAVPAGRGGADPSGLFGVDLQVEAPASWLVAGPGCIAPTDGPAVQPAASGSRRFRVRPSAPVAAVGLFASRFERRTGAAGRTRVDLLLAPQHAGNLGPFLDAAEALRDRVAEVLADAAAHDLPYPYECITAVEIPASLRGYGGGWRMATALALPGVLPIRERAFPTTAYGRILAFPGHTGAANVHLLDQFRIQDWSGASPLEWLSHNILLDQTDVIGRGAETVRFALHEMLALALGYEVQSQLVSPRLTSGDARPHRHIVDAFLNRIPGVPAAIGWRWRWSRFSAPSVRDDDVWQYVETVPPIAYPDATSPMAAVALETRGEAVARTLFDVLGRERILALLAELRGRHADAGFAWGELETAAADLGVDVQSLFGSWLENPRLPGFRASSATVARVRDDDQGRPRYAIRLHVYNAEPIPGVVRLSKARNGDFFIGEPVPVAGLSAVEISVAVPEPPDQIWLWPSLSLSRKAVLRIGHSTVAESNDAEPFFGARQSAWRPDETNVVVDDLDPGFSIEATSADASGRLRSVAADARWRQDSFPGSWGRYRDTAAITSGEGRTRAVFAAAIETPGRYHLDYHVPDRRLPDLGGGMLMFDALGNHEITVQAADFETALVFDGSAAEVGWNKLGSFDLATGPVRVAVSDRAGGATVIADAIRWRPAKDSGGAPGASNDAGPTED